MFFVGVKESTGHKCSTFAILKGAFLLAIIFSTFYFTAVELASRIGVELGVWPVCVTVLTPLVVE